LFWILTGADYDPPQPHARAWPERCELWVAIQRSLGALLAAIGSDAKARDLARITRIPGTINSKNDTRVGYWVQFDYHGKMPLYTLTSLASHFRIAPRKRVAKPSTPQPATYRERGIRGARGRWQRARTAFERLWKMRGGFGPGTRNSAVWTYTIILRQQRLQEAEIEAAIERLFRDFGQPADDPYTLDAAISTMRSAKPGRIRNDTMADMLGVTPDEALAVGWPHAKRFGKQPTRMTRREIARQRRQLIADTIRRMGHMPYSAEIAELVEQSGLPRPSRQVISQDVRLVNEQKLIGGGSLSWPGSARGHWE
jgi:hypothetical protein